MNLNVYFRCFLAILLLQNLYFSHQVQYLYVDKCPLNMSSRRRHSENLNCTNEGIINVYHCLPTEGNGFMERCYPNLALITSDGCPYFTTEDSVTQIRQRICNGISSKCPDIQDQQIFLSSKAYKFPGCFVLSKRTYLFKEITTQINSTYNTYTDADMHGSGKTDTEAYDYYLTTKANKITGEGSFRNKYITWLGAGFICASIGGILLILLKRSAMYAGQVDVDSNAVFITNTNMETDVEIEDVYDYINDVRGLSSPY